jgi:hypothetical protein
MEEAGGISRFKKWSIGLNRANISADENRWHGKQKAEAEIRK